MFCDANAGACDENSFRLSRTLHRTQKCNAMCGLGGGKESDDKAQLWWGGGAGLK